METARKYLFFSTIFLFIYALCSVTNGADLDLWHRMAVGQIFWQTGSVFYHDIFAYTHVKDLWVDHEWGTGVIFYALIRLFGDYGLIFLRIFLFFAVIILIFATNQLIIGQKNNFKTGFYLVSSYAVFYGFQNYIRSQVFTYFFFTLWIYMLERVRKDEPTEQYLKYIWVFPVTMLIWANLHGGFITGLGLLLIYAAGEFLNRNKSLIYLKILALSLPVTLINPYGIKFWEYMATAATMPRPYIIEWLPINLTGYLYDYLGFKLLLLATIFAWSYKLSLKNKKINWTGAILLVVTLCLTLNHQRHVVFFAIAAAIFSFQYYYEAVTDIYNKYVSKYLEFLSPKSRNLLNFGITSALVIPIIVFVIHTAAPLSIKVSDTDYPARAVEFIRINNLKGNLLLPFNWGSYALWKLYPQCKVSLDGRYEETYPDYVYKEVTDFVFRNKNWNNVLKKYHNDVILVPAKTDIYSELKKVKNWKLIYKDKNAALFIPITAHSKSWKFPDKNIDYSKMKLNTVVRHFGN